jgi:hypothetical protein
LISAAICDFIQGRQKAAKQLTPFCVERNKMEQVEFVPIRVVGFDESKIKRDSVEKHRYRIPFILSAKPPQPWRSLFDETVRSLQEESPETGLDAHAKKSNIVIESSPADLKQRFASLKAAIDAANGKYAGLLQQKSEKSDKRRKNKEDKKAELQTVRETLAGLDFS